MTFGSSSTILLVGWPFDTQQLIKTHLVENAADWKRVTRLCAMRSENSDTWNVERLRGSFAAVHKVTAWLFAVLDWLQVAKAEGKELKVPYAEN